MYRHKVFGGILARYEEDRIGATRMFSQVRRRIVHLVVNDELLLEILVSQRQTGGIPRLPMRNPSPLLEILYDLRGSGLKKLLPRFDCPAE